MKKNNGTTEYVEKFKDIKLSESSRARIQDNLLEYARFHSVRVGEEGRSIEQVPRRTSLFTLFKRKSMNAAIIAIILIAGGGTSYAAEGAVPGDFLYTMKTDVNENVKSAFAVGANAEAELQASLMTERLEEANKLKAESKLNGETGVKMRAAMKEQAETTASVATKAEGAAKATASERIVNTLSAYNVLVENDATLAIAIDGLEMDAEFRTFLSTSPANQPVDVARLADNTEKRAAALRTLIANSSAEISASVKTELETKLTNAMSIVAEASLQAEVEAREKLFEASDLVGQVEAKLSTLGTATIDQNNGAIIDIDFSKVPPTQIENSSETRGETRTESRTDTNSDSSVDVDVDAASETDVDSGVIKVNTNSSIKSTSGVSL